MINFPLVPEILFKSNSANKPALEFLETLSFIVQLFSVSFAIVLCFKIAPPASDEPKLLCASLIVKPFNNKLFPVDVTLIT